MSIIKFNSNYVSTVLSPGINAIILRTELGGNSNLINSFSFAGGKSTYSFGLYQFDVGNNSLAASFLKSIGFTAVQIALLSKNGGLSNAQISILNAQLKTALQNPLNQKALQALNSTQANSLITQLENSLNVVALKNPGIANQITQNPELQLRMIDYANQFNLSPSAAAGTMTGWLCGLPGKTILTSAMVQNFVMNTVYGKSNPVSEGNRELALNTELKNLALPTVAFIESGSLAGSVVLENTSVTGIKTFRLLAPNGTLTNGVLSGIGNVSFNSNGTTYSVKNGVVITTAGNTKALQMSNANQINLPLQVQSRIDMERFVQAMAGFAPPSSAQTSWTNAQVNTVRQVLLAVTH